jgi:hypothetical protein
MSKPVRLRGGAPVAASVEMRTKTPSLRSASDASEAVRLSQASPARPGASPKLVKAKVAKKERDPNSDPFTESDRLRAEIEAEFGMAPSGAEKLPWMDHLDSLDARLLANLREDAMIDTSVIATFNAEAAKIPIRDDVFGVTREMMDAGIGAIRQKLNRESDLLRERMSLVQQMQLEIMAASAAACSTEIGPEDDPDFDPDNA